MNAPQGYTLDVIAVLDEYRGAEHMVNTEAIIDLVQQKNPEVDREKIKAFVMKEVFERGLNASWK